jgi:hypothetical protein
MMRFPTKHFKENLHSSEEVIREKLIVLHIDILDEESPLILNLDGVFQRWCLPS